MSIDKSIFKATVNVIFYDNNIVKLFHLYYFLFCLSIGMVI